MVNVGIRFKPSYALLASWFSTSCSFGHLAASLYNAMKRIMVVFTAFNIEGLTMATLSGKTAAKDFVERWSGRGDEKQDAQSYWRDLLVNVLGAPSATLANFVSFERKVPGGYIDVFIEDTGVLVEQKSLGIDLEKSQQQSDGALLTPYEQGARYAMRLPLSIRPRWIIACNFERMLIYDQENDPTGEHPQELLLENLPNELYRLGFILDKSNSRIEREKELSVKAGEIVGKLYKSFAEQYRNLDTDEHEQRSLNMLIVRLVFLLYAEDAGLFNSHGALYDYLKPFPVEQMRRALMELFEILDTPEEERDPYARPDLLEFRYVNGGLFADRDIIIPQFTEQIKLDLLVEASSKFDWSGVSPTIFGAVFESTLNPDTRRSGGMHYTSVENIHKVIDPLFLDDLKAELERIEGLKSERDRRIRLKAYQQKLSQINVFDPACGSGNFLTESYLALRKLENRAIEGMQRDGTAQLGFEGETNPIKVSLSQFHGIEINDFAVSVAKTAMWIAESQMIEATQEIVYQVIDFLPLKSGANIQEGNALRMNWDEDVLPADRCAYICGNPPFLGHISRSEEQSQELRDVWQRNDIGRLDYVSGWYKKAIDYAAANDAIEWAFVSTNSIAMGEPVPALFGYVFDNGWRIKFAHRTFVWDSEASDRAHVHVVIIGFTKSDAKPMLFSYSRLQGEPTAAIASNINGYLLDAPNVFIEQRRDVLSPSLNPVTMGNMPRGTGLIIEADDIAPFMEDPIASKYVRRFLMGRELINNGERYCLWMEDLDPKDVQQSELLRSRIEDVRLSRLESSAKSTREMAETPHLFGQRAFVPTSNYVGIPSVFSGNRKYATCDYLEPSVIPGNKIYVCDDSDGFQFAMISSNAFIAWQKAIGGRLKSDCNFSNTVVWNNFPVPEFNDEARQKVIDAGKLVLSARAAHEGDSLAQMYDGISPLPENPSRADLVKYDQRIYDDLREAHRALDAAVAEAFGIDFAGDEGKIVAHLFKLYADATKE